MKNQRNDTLREMHARKPIDKTAALVISAGEHWEPVVRDPQHDSDLPIPTTTLPPGAKDMRGLRVGRLTVLGYWGRSKSGKGTAARHRWVVRCDCGTYSVRRVASLQAAIAADRLECCQKCKALRDLQGRAKEK